MTPSRLLPVDDFQHVFEGQRLEIQPVRGVVVGGNGFRVAVDHDGLETLFAQGQRRVHAAVVELDALPDAVRSAAQHHDFSPVVRLGFAFLLVGRVEVGGRGGEFGGTGVDPLVDRADVQSVAVFAHPAFGLTEQLGEAAVGESFALQLEQLLLLQ